MPAATIRSWLFSRPYETAAGQQYSVGVIEPPGDSLDRLSFLNLIEAHVLRSLRTRHGVSMGDVRKALEYAQSEFGIDRLLIHDQLKAAPGHMFLERYSGLIDLPKGGQLALKDVFEAHLERVVHDAKDHLPVRFYPWFPIEGQQSKRVIVVDPRVAFGSPITETHSIRTAVIADRYEAGEAVDDLANDYELDHGTIEDAIRFERAA